MAISTHLSIITLNVNGLSVPTRHITAKWIQKQDIYIYTHTHTHTHIHIYCLQDFHFRSKDTQTKSDGMKKYIPCK